MTRAAALLHETGVRAPDATLPRSPAPQTGTVVVLGGSGFAGAAIIEALTRTGYATVSAQRHAPSARGNTTQIRWDATQSADIRHLSQGALCVVNAVSGNNRVLLAATRALLAAADGACRIVHLSSMDVYGNTRGYVREDATLRADSRYGAAKIACENMLAGKDAVILRPGLIYGPGSAQWVGRIGRLLRAHRIGDLGKHGDGRCNLVFARDLGEAVVAAIGNSAAAGYAINIGMTAPPRWNDFLVAFGRSIGAVPVRRIPAWRLTVEASVAPALHLARHAAHALGRTPDILPDLISPSLRRVFAQDIVLDCSLADRLLGFPHTSLADGLAESAAWFIESHGLAEG
jgi:nucleoside-diphosphate-sugar epimerase